MEIVSKLTQEEISKLKKGKSIEQKVFDKLTQEEMQVYFKTNMQANDGSLNLYSLQSLPKGIKFPVKCKHLYLYSLQSLPEEIKFPENCEKLNLFKLQSLPSDFFKNNPDLKGKVYLKNNKIQ
jgi:hypothetical protein